MSALVCALSLARSLPLDLPYMTEKDLEFSGGSDQQHNAWFHQLLRVLMPLRVCFCHAYRETAWFLTNISTRANANPALHHLFAATIPLACHAQKGPYRLRTGDSFWVSRECYTAVPTFPPYESGTSWWRSRCFKVRRTFTFALNRACIETSTQKPICATQRQAVACRSLSHAAPSSCRPYEVQE